MLDVARWLAQQGLGHHAEAFVENGIDGDILHDLTDADLKELGLNLGDRKRLLKAIAALDAGPTQDRITQAESIATAAAPREAERRQLTVMFVDLVGSTALSARLDPEDMSAVMRAYQERCAEVVRRWDGHVAKYMGDGVLAYFGWPQAHEDEAERAVRAGLDLTDAIELLAAPSGEALAARVGIATGLVMVGELIGEGAAQEQTVVGETPNLAARLQALAMPGSLVISQGTRRLVGGLFELADIGPLSLKGFAEPVAAWRVEGEGRAEGRFEALHGERLTPLVGREHELGILLERWAWAKDGDGQMVFLSGEPGIGKSRVIRTLRERIGNEPYTPLSHYCSPYHANSALYPVIDLLERAARLDRDEPAEEQLAKLEAVLARASDRLDHVVPLLAALLGVPTGERYPTLALTPEVQKQRTLQALVDQLAGLAAQQPVLALYEDVHWIDPSTVELLSLVIERVQRLPVLALITFRSEFQPPWTAQAHVTTLTMGRLGRRQGADLVARVSGEKPMPTEVVEQIVARTDGVPLFVEELTKTVLESGLLADAGDRWELAGPLPPLAIPATLHDSLMARLDRLAKVKEVAQIGAVIGRDFSHGLLATVADRPEPQLHAALDELVNSELVFRRGTRPTPPTPSSTPWSRTRPTSRCSCRSVTSCTPGLQRRSKGSFPTRPKRSRSCWPSTSRTRAWRRGRSPIGGAPASWPQRVRRTWKRSLTSARGSSWSERCRRPRNSSTRNWPSGWRSVVHSLLPRAMRLQRLSGPIAGPGRCANNSAGRTSCFRCCADCGPTTSCGANSDGPMI
jgi:class 3 adenylate cyclase